MHFLTSKIFMLTTIDEETKTFKSLKFKINISSGETVYEFFNFNTYHMFFQ